MAISPMVHHRGDGGSTGTTQVKIAGNEWAAHQLRQVQRYRPAGDRPGQPLCANGEDLPFNVDKAGTYKFVFTAMNKDKPT